MMEYLSKGSIVYHIIKKQPHIVEDISETFIFIYPKDESSESQRVKKFQRGAIGEWLFLSLEDIDLSVEELSLKEAYTHYGNKRIVDCHRKRVVENENTEIKRIIDDLVSFVKKEIKALPDLKSVNKVFSNHHSGKYCYSDTFEQKLYLIRYFYAYYYEYRKMIAEIAQYMDEINMFSIGTGSGIDALALQNIAAYHNKEFTYYGVDIIDWVDRKNIIGELPQVTFLKHKISDQTPCLIENANVICFPKSLSDIGKVEMESILKWLKEAKCLQKKIFIIASFTNPTDQEREEYIRYLDIIKIFLEKNYDFKEDQSIICKMQPNLNKKIWEYDINFANPDNLLDFFRRELTTLCAKYNNHGIHCELCEKRGDGPWYLQPKLSYSGIHYECTVLTKGDDNE